MNPHDEAMRDLADLYLLSDKSPRAERRYDSVGVAIINMKAERDALLAVARATMRVRQCEGDICLSTDELDALDALPDNIKKEVEG